MADDDEASEEPPLEQPEKSLTTAETEANRSVADIVTEIQGMPPEIRQQFQSFMAMVQSQSRMPADPLLEKFNDAHIDKYLDYLQRDYDNEYALQKSNRWFYLGYFAISVAALSLAVIYLLPRDKDMLEFILQILIILAGGIGAGYGLAKRKGN